MYSPINPQEEKYILINNCIQCNEETPNPKFCTKECLFNYLYDTMK